MPYLPPARINDFARSLNSAQLADDWHARITREIDRYRSFARFLDPLDADETAVREVIPWTGFPRIFDAWLDIEGSPDPVESKRRMNRAHRSAEILDRFIHIKLQSDGQFYRFNADPAAGLMLFPEINGSPSFQDGFSLAERPQDEYLEWFVVRDPNTNRITRIDFTAEAPEYWQTLARGDGELTGTLYSELLGVTVPTEDLFFQNNILCPEIRIVDNRVEIVGHVRAFQRGQYNPRNKWNTELGAVHLTQRNNTLFAEINLAANATKRFAIRPDIGTNVDRFSLIGCGGYGAPNRNSDPTIGQSVNTLALSEFRAMVSNPIGLYIGEIDVSGFRDPQGQSVPRDRIVTIHRGSFQDADGLARVLRFSVHPPEGADYGLETCTFNGFPLLTGGPIARRVTVVIHGIAMPEDNNHPLTGCGDKTCPHPTKTPQFFLTVAPQEDCPRPDDEIWTDVPITLAPEESIPSPTEAVGAESAASETLSDFGMADEKSGEEFDISAGVKLNPQTVASDPGRTVRRRT